MCEPTTIIAGLSLAFGAMSAYQQSASAEASMEYQAQVAQNNAITAEYQAQDALKRGEVAEAEQRRRTAMMKGSQTARLAANGLDISEGSALNMLSDTDWMGERDALTVRDNASREAWAYRQQGANSQSNSNMLSASADAQNPLFAAGTSIMTSPALGSVSSKWYKMSGNSGPSGTNQSAGTSTSVFA